LGQAAIIDDALPGGGLVEIDIVEHAVQLGRVLAAHRAHGIGEGLTQAGGDALHTGPAGALRDIKAHQATIPLGQRLGQLATAELTLQAGELIRKDVGEALDEDEGQDIVLELGRVEWAADDAGRLPEPVTQGGQVEGGLDDH